MKSVLFQVKVEYIVLEDDKRVFLSDDELVAVSEAAQGVRLAAKIVDMPCSVMDTTQFVQVWLDNEQIFNNYIFHSYLT